MSGDKREFSSLDSFVTITKKTLITSSSSQQTESVQSELVTHEIDQFIDGELEESENIDSSNVNQNLIVVDSHPDTHDNDIGFQLSLRTPLTDEIKYKLLTKPFRSDKNIHFQINMETMEQFRRFMLTWLDQHSFLSYSPYYEGAFCIACSLFSPLASS